MLVISLKSYLLWTNFEEEKEKNKFVLNLWRIRGKKCYYSILVGAQAGLNDFWCSKIV